jgi:nitric oxide reductase NorE protein
MKPENKEPVVKRDPALAYRYFEVRPVSPGTAVAIEPSRPAPMPGDLAMWFFIFAELLVFGIFFLAYAFARAADPALFAAGQASIDQLGGAINTVLLITSSYAVARAVAAVKVGALRSCRRWLELAMLLGLGFVVLKLAGFADLTARGIDLSTDTFFMFYLSLTGFHFLHVLMGLIILAAVWLKARRGGYSAAEHTGVETGASYWHMVDLVWIILFALVYVLR